MSSLSVMFDTFVWFLGEEPFLRLNPKDPNRIIEMDSVGKSCMQAENLVSPPRKRIKVRVMTPDLVHDFQICSDGNLKVECLVEAVNSQAETVMDVQNQDILVSQVTFDGGTIVLACVFHEFQRK